jgi:hypothetical protein
MTTLGGGSVAAYGLKYQYLATLEHFLRCADDADVAHVMSYLE